jgi:hypothetical protein
MGQTEQFSSQLSVGPRAKEVFMQVSEGALGVLQGPVAYAEGLWNAGRFVVRATGLAGGVEYQRARAESATLGFFAENYFRSPVFREAVNTRLEGEVLNARPAHAAIAVSRFATGLYFAPSGGASALGSVLRGIEDTQGDVVTGLVHGVVGSFH